MERSSRVVVLGNVALDISFRVDRLPQRGESSLASPPAYGLGGKGANQAVAAGRAGAAVLLIAPFGDDEDGRRLKGWLDREPVRLKAIERPGASDRSIIFVLPDGENAIATTRAQALALAIPDVAPSLDELAQGDVLLMQGNLSAEVTRFALGTARARGARAILNPSPLAFPFEALWPLADVAVLNRQELHALGLTVRTLMEAGAGAVVLTTGAEGCVTADGAGEHALPAPPVPVIDTTGAGDMFAGTLAAGLVQGLSLSESAAWAVRTASEAVGRCGTVAAFPSRERCLSLRPASAHEA
ncbi:PfkB family carbohydrate kinase [Marinivivus vitaminiproducens]|uniref:PfkB family carbohydrate kinase n=1 Tax=Marinivivus vitaminiproducens TaxID=3035935 RepID=UPI00279D3B36|nr:PfkB family carbohydrate kinase [Geminicoccaceae bacterium SCSIO 64248]